MGNWSAMTEEEKWEYKDRELKKTGRIHLFCTLAIVAIFILLVIVGKPAPACDAHAVVLKGSVADCAVERSSDQPGTSR